MKKRKKVKLIKKKSIKERSCLNTHQNCKAIAWHLASTSTAKVIKRARLNAKHLVGIILIAGIFINLPFFYVGTYEERIYPGVKLGELNLSGLTLDQAILAIEKYFDAYESKGFSFTALDRTVNLRALISAPEDPDITYELVKFNAKETAESAFSVGRGNPNAILKLFQFFQSFKKETQIKPYFTINETVLRNTLSQLFHDLEIPAQNANIRFDSLDHFSAPEVTSEKNGLTFDYIKASQDITQIIQSLSEEPVLLAEKIELPTILRREAELLLPQAKKVLDAPPLIFSYEKLKWKISPSNLAQALEVKKENGTARIGVNLIKIEELLTEAKEIINVSVQDAKFEIDPITKKIQNLFPGQEGREIDFEKLVRMIEEELEKSIKGEKASLIVIPVNRLTPKIYSDSASDLGIKDLLGVGRSNFSGSPPNRVYNIRQSVNKLNGLLIAPNEEFSLIGALRPISIENGYLPEMVIKGDEIVPEVGGGLCQIGTTTFRAAMAAGLPITERKNHSLVVSYYNDPQNNNPGTDATIYDPHPDLRFINNTGYWILLTTEMDEKTSELAFSLWGTSDGRKGSWSPPQVLNWKAAGEPREIETTKLPPGEKRCQRGYRGADTIFTYRVEFPNGEIKEEEFISHYRSLPPTCLIGVEPSPIQEGEKIE